MNYYTIPALIGFFINLYLFIFILIKKVDIDFKINFLLYLIGPTCYCFLEFLAENSNDPEIILLSIQLMALLLQFSIPAIFITIVYLINRKINRKLYFLYLFYLILPFLIFHRELLIDKIYPIYFGYYGHWGTYTKIIGYFALIYLPICIILLIKSYLHNKNDIYLKKPYKLFTTALGSVIVIFWFIVLLQAVLDNYNYGVGTFSSTLTLAGITIFYLIYRFKFLNIEIIFENIQSYIMTILFVIISVIFYAFYYYIFSIKDFKIIYATSLVAIIAVNILFKNKILDVIKLKFYKNEEDFINKFTPGAEIILLQKNENDILKKFLKMLDDIFNISNTLFIKTIKNNLKIKNFHDNKFTPLDLKLKPLKLINYFKENNFLELNPFQEIIIKRSINNDNYDRLRKNNIRLLFSLKDENILYGIICIKDRTDQKIFNYHEIILLKFLMKFLSLIIKQNNLIKKIERKDKIEFSNKILSLILHDLKNIISSLEMSIENIYKYFHNKEFQKDLVKLFTNTLRKIDQVEFKLINIQEHEINKIRFNPVNLIRTTIREFSNYNIKTEFNENKMHILFDKEKFIQLIKNLVINAIESGDYDKLSVKIKTDLKNDKYTITIIDNGKGMDKEFIINKLFIPFTSTKPKGLGLGLYNCKEILKLHNGDINISSSPDKGTEAIITIPV